MATFQLRLRTRNIKSSEYPIVLRIIHNRKSKEIVVLDIRVNKKYWDSKYQKIKTSFPRSNYFNKKLNDVKRKIDNRIIELNEIGHPYNTEDVIVALDSNFNSKSLEDKTLSEIIYDYIELNPDNIQFQTLKYYKTSANRWNELYPNLLIGLITEDNILSFRKYLIDQGNSTNTIYNRLKVLRKIFKYLKRKGIIGTNPMADIKLESKRGQREFLSMDEISLIQNYFTNSVTEEIARDLFLFECFTGLRISDICTLTKSDIIKEEENYRIKKRLTKTSEMLTMKLSKRAEQILLKYFVDRNQTMIFPVLDSSLIGESDSKFRKISSVTASINKSLKTISKKVGISKNVSTHIGRHSFAVNSITMGADIYVLSKLLGHTSIKTTEIYAKVVDKKKDELIDLWDTI